MEDLREYLKQSMVCWKIAWHKVDLFVVIGVQQDKELKTE